MPPPIKASVANGNVDGFDLNFFYSLYLIGPKLVTLSQQQKGGERLSSNAQCFLDSAVKLRANSVEVPSAGANSLAVLSGNRASGSPFFTPAQ